MRALLLPLKSGANGINLVEAQHVFLVEPLIETAVEAQAIGRVHRMSQTRPTTVHRFVVTDTIEESIRRMRQRAAAAAASGAPAAAAANDGAAAGGAASASGAGSPTKRGARRVEEAKVLSWDHVLQLFSASGQAEDPVQLS